MSLGIDTDGRSQNSYSSGIDIDGRSQNSYSEEQETCRPTVCRRFLLVATICVDLQLHGVSLQIDTDGNSQHKNGCTVSLGIDTDGRSQNSYSSGIDTDGRSQHSYSEE